MRIVLSGIQAGDDIEVYVGDKHNGFISGYITGPEYRKEFFPTLKEALGRAHTRWYQLRGPFPMHVLFRYCAIHERNFDAHIGIDYKAIDYTPDEAKFIRQVMRIKRVVEERLFKDGQVIMTPDTPDWLTRLREQRSKPGGIGVITKALHPGRQPCGWGKPAKPSPKG